MRILPIIIAIVLMGMLVLLAGCQQKTAPDDQKQGMDHVTGSHVTELEKTACSSAESSDTCDSKLASLGFITKEQCCEKYGKCC